MIALRTFSNLKQQQRGGGMEYEINSDVDCERDAVLSYMQSMINLARNGVLAMNE